MDSVKIIQPDPNAAFALPTLDVSGLKRKFLDLNYAGTDDARQTLDLYLPDEGDGPFPLIVFIHGGAFIGGDKRDFQVAFFMNGIRRGYAVASLNHRFSNESKFPESVYDVKAAVRFLRANAARFCLDPKRFAASGASAGAYYAAMLGCTAGVPAFEDLSMGNPEADSSVQAVIGMFGVYDLEWCSRFSDAAPPMPSGYKMPNFADLFVGVNCRENRELVSLTYPGNYVTKDCPPTLIEGGTADQVVPYEASPAFVEKINAVCGAGRATLQVIEGCTHGHPDYGSPENEARMFAFLDKALK
jgi:acetyl esterase/lipase